MFIFRWPFNLSLCIWEKAFIAAKYSAFELYNTFSISKCELNPQPFAQLILTFYNTWINPVKILEEMHLLYSTYFKITDICLTAVCLGESCYLIHFIIVIPQNESPSHFFLSSLIHPSFSCLFVEDFRSVLWQLVLIPFSW